MGLLAVFPLSAALAIFTKKKFEEMSFFSICIIIFSILASGLFGTTLVGLYFDFFLVAFSVIYCVYHGIKNRKRFKSSVCTQGAFALILFYIIAVALYSSYSLRGSDVNRVYGPQIVNMWMYDDLGGNLEEWVGSLLYTAPVVPAWSYFCLKLWPSYSDGLCMMSYFVYCVAALLPLFKYVKKNEWLRFILLFVSVISLFALNYEENISLYYVDTATASTAVFGLVMILELYRKKTDFVYLVEASCVPVILSGIKRVGGAAGFGMISIIAFMTMERLFCDKYRKERLREKMLPTLSLLSASVISCAFGLFRWYKGQDSIMASYSGVLFFVAWYLTGIISWIIKVLISKKKYIGCFLFCTVPISTVIFLLRKYFDGEYGEGYFNKVFMFFTGALFNSSNQGWNHTPFPLIVIAWGAAGILIYLNLIRNEKEEEKDNRIWKYTTFVITVSYLVWLAVWLVMYTWQNVEKNDYVYCTVRYMCVGPMTICGLLLYEMLSTKVFERDSVLFFYTAALFMSTYHYPEDIFVSKFCQGRKDYVEVYEKAGLELTSQDSIFFIDTEYRHLSDYYPYYSFPAVSGALPGGVYSSHNDDYEKISAETLAEAVGSYKYVFINSIDDEFKKSYDSLFKEGVEGITDNSVYRVNTENGVKLELLATGDKDYINSVW